MNPYRLPIVAVFLLLFGGGGCKSRLDKQTAAIFSGATRVEVFHIDGHKRGDEEVDGCAILSRGDDQGQEFAAKLRDILADNKTYSNIHANCYDPGVAFRIWKDQDSLDLIICFNCNNFYLSPSSDKHHGSNASFHGSPNRKRLVQLAKEAFPNDEEVQALKDE